MASEYLQIPLDFPINNQIKRASRWTLSRQSSLNFQLVICHCARRREWPTESDPRQLPPPSTFRDFPQKKKVSTGQRHHRWPNNKYEYENRLRQWHIFSHLLEPISLPLQRCVYAIKFMLMQNATDCRIFVEKTANENGRSRVGGD